MPEWVVLLPAQSCSEAQKSQLHASNQDLLAGCLQKEKMFVATMEASKLVNSEAALYSFLFKYRFIVSLI